MNALFLIPAAYGHLNRSFLVAQQLQQQGFSIHYGYLGDMDAAKTIQRQGFTVQWLTTYPFGVGIDEVVNNGQTDSWLETLIDRFTNRQFRDRTADLTRLIQTLRPNLIILDAFQSTDFIILYPMLAAMRCRVVLLQTMLPTYDDGYAPPLNTSLIPGRDALHTIRQAWRREYARRFLAQLGDSLKYGGMSRRRQIRWAFRKNKLPNTHALRLDKVFHVGFRGLEEWITAPQAIDFLNRPLQPGQQYLGLTIDPDRVEDLPPPYRQTIAHLEQERLSKPTIKILYASLGTMQEARKKGAEQRFFTELCAVARQQPNWRLVLAVRPALVNALPKTPANVWVFGHVPQLHLLQRIDVFITHGGLNSVLEAIHYQVPMLVYAFNTHWDLPGNAARVVAHGIGQQGDFYQDKALNITMRLNELLTCSSVSVALKKRKSNFKSHY